MILGQSLFKDKDIHFKKCRLEKDDFMFRSFQHVKESQSAGFLIIFENDLRIFWKNP